MKVYVFGNEDYAPDSLAFEVMKHLEGKIDGVAFEVVKPNQDLPFVDHDLVVILDAISGIETVTLIMDDQLDHLVMSPRNSVHDFDLGFQLKYLKKLGKLGKVTILGLPMTGAIDYDRVISNLRKLVAQDMQGS